MSTLRDRYRIHNKAKSNKSLLIYIAIFSIFIFSATFSRYISQSNGTFGMELADWNIEINNKLITPEITTLNNEIKLIPTENISQDGLIKPGQKGYFDIIINPEDTEVSLNYKIIIDTTKLPSQINFTKYAINNSNTKINMPSSKTIEDYIYLDGKEKLDSSDKKQYRIFWEWPVENAKIENIMQEYKITANLQIRQIVD